MNGDQLFVEIVVVFWLEKYLSDEAREDKSMISMWLTWQRLYLRRHKPNAKMKVTKKQNDMDVEWQTKIRVWIVLVNQEGQDRPKRFVIR